MENRRRLTTILGSIVLGLGVVYLLAVLILACVDMLKGLTSEPPADLRGAIVPSPSATPSPLTTKGAMNQAPISPLARQLEELFAKLQAGDTTESDLDALKRALLAADPAQANAAILGFLATDRDARTGLDFALRPGGELAAPTLRVLLMDVLGRIAQRDGTDTAAKLARATLAKKDSPDEWAIALRNVAWREPAATAFLAAKTREMLTYAPWRAAPSGGMLEAFDVIVFTKDASFAPDLATAQTDPNSALRHAAEVALDRLAAANPLDVMTYLNSHPTTLAERPMLRADYFAKADLANAGQKTALEYYLSRPDIAAAEKTKLLKALATPASFVSENLLTGAPPEIDDTKREQALLAVTGQWVTSNRFPALQNQLLQLQRRLARE